MHVLSTVFAMFLGLGGFAFAQGTVNVNNRGLITPQLVMFNNDYPQVSSAPSGPVVGTQYVAQIVYGPARIELGAPMPFRAPTTIAPGVWNPGPNAIRTLNGFTEGQAVEMIVHVWDTTPIPGISGSQTTWDDVQSLATRDSLPQGYQWGSTSFTYVVGAASNPVALQIANFRGFELTTYYIPEPNVIALGVLGGLGLIWFVRRRR